MGPLADYLAKMQARKAELGLVEDTEALRNSGEQRSPEKRRFLKSIEARAKAAGKTPVKGNF
jgi:hypothetical protein